MHPELSRRTFVLFEMSPHAALVHSASLTRPRFHLKTESVERMSGASSTPLGPLVCLLSATAEDRYAIPSL